MPAASCRLEIGMTERGLQDLGDISRITRLKDRLDGVKVGEDILSMDWEGHIITSADELYHTVWDPVEGKYLVEAPVAGKVEYLIEGNGVAEESEVLVAILADAKSVETVMAELVTEDEYLRSVEGPGAFDSRKGYR